MSACDWFYVLAGGAVLLIGVALVMLMGLIVLSAWHERKRRW